MAQVTGERLAELIAWEEADIPDYQAVNDEAGARCVKDSLDLIAALRELQQARAKLAGVKEREDAFSDAVMHIVGPELHVRVWEEYDSLLSRIQPTQQSTDDAARSK